MPPLTEILEEASRVRRVPGPPVKPPADLRLLRWLVYLYLALWVFEGALRKWIFPSLSNPLLIVRDPLLLLLYALAYAKGVFPRSAFISAIAILGALATFVSLAATDTPIAVTLFGLRSDFLHLPLIFLLPQILRRADLRVIGKFALLTAVGMGALVLLQFRSASGSWLNAGAGEGAVMLDSAFGHIRPSGTFSFTNGLTAFTALTASFFLQHLLEKRVYPRVVWLATIPALLVMVVLSGSRLAAATLGLILATVLLISLVQRRYRAASLKLAALLGIAVFLIGSFTVFKSGMDVFSKRFESNGVEQNGLLGRYVDAYLLPFRVMDRTEWGGVGLGMGTNVAAGLTLGHRKIMLSEGEGGRVVFESGPVVGFAYLMLRLCITVYLGAETVRALRLHAATLPLLLFSGCFNEVMVGQFSQSTALGYATISAGLCLAACRAAGEPAGAEEEAEETEEAAPVKRVGRGGQTTGGTAAATEAAAAVKTATPSAPPIARGRSAYAARLHADPPKEEREKS